MDKKGDLKTDTFMMVVLFILIMILFWGLFGYQKVVDEKRICEMGFAHLCWIWV